MLVLPVCLCHFLMSVGISLYISVIISIKWGENIILVLVVSQGLWAPKNLQSLWSTYLWPGPLKSFPVDPTFSDLKISGLCRTLHALPLPWSLYNFRGLNLPWPVQGRDFGSGHSLPQPQIHLLLLGNHFSQPTLFPELYEGQRVPATQ